MAMTLMKRDEDPDTQEKDEGFLSKVPFLKKPGRARRVGEHRINPVKPSVSLVPPKLAALRKLRRVRRASIFGVAGATLLSLLVGGVVTIMAQQAEQSAEEAQARTEVQRLAVAELEPVEDYYYGFEERKGIVSDALINDIDYPTLMDGIDSVLPDDVTINRLSTSFGDTCATPDPFSGYSGLGCITLELQGGSFSDPGRIAEEVSEMPGLSGAYVRQVTQHNSLSFTMTVNFDAEPTEDHPFGARSGKFRDYVASDELTQDEAPEDGADDNEEAAD